MAKGFAQEYVFDYEETSARVAHVSSIHIFIVIAAF
jgi:hypothetical protein